METLLCKFTVERRLNMLNKIWLTMMAASILYSFFNGTYAETVAAGIASCSDTIRLLITLLGIMCFFNGLLKIADRAGITKIIARILQPVLGRLFRDVPPDSEAFGAMTLNITANLLGMGNAATPLGISAMEKLKKQNHNRNTASHAMCLFVILNTSSIQLIPSTILSLRMNYGSGNPFFIVFPMWISSLTGLLVGILAAKFFRAREERILTCRQ